MNKKFKYLLIILVLFVGVFTISGCKKSDNSNNEEEVDNANELVGTWEYEAGSFIFKFNNDLTGTYTMGTSVQNFTYEIIDNKVSIIYEGTTAPFKLEYRIEGKTLIIIDSFGQEVKYIKK